MATGMPNERYTPEFMQEAAEDAMNEGFSDKKALMHRFIFSIPAISQAV